MRVVALSALVLWSCVVPDPELTDLDCPCLEEQGWGCDSRSNTCVRFDDVCGAVGAEPSNIEVTEMVAEFSTERSIWWRWEIADDTDLSSFEMLIGLSEESVSTRAADVRVIDGDENPELRRPILSLTSAGNPVRATVTRELDEDRTYFARLVVFDTAGRVSCSSVVRASTTVATNRVTIYDDATQPGLREPSVITTESDPARASEGDTFEQLVADCSPDNDTCSEDLGAETCWCQMWRMHESAIDVSSMSSGDFEAAFLEIALAVDGSADLYWGGVGVTLGAGFSSDLFTRSGITLPSDRGYVVHQVPLRSMERFAGSGTLSFEELNGGIGGYNVASTYEDGAIIRVDDVSIRW